jgi:membrane-bound lytic murein transglycosylase F
LGKTNKIGTGIFAFVLSILVILGGCSPVSESLVKKAQFGSVQDASKREGREGIRTSGMGVPQADRLMILSYGRLIKDYSRQYGMDWRLVLAVMKAESGFSHDAESERGAAGLMQIMPFTGEEVARDIEVQNLAHPMNNIHGGIFYLKKLYALFEGSEERDRVELTLAAYNAGVGRIYDAQVLAAYFHDNPRKWASIKEALPLLSKRYYTLHRNVWDQGKPKIAGWFGSSRETLAYVTKVMGYYEDYQSVLD